MQKTCKKALKGVVLSILLFSECYGSDKQVLDLVPPEKPLKVITFDGGGIRGLFSLYLYEEIQRHMGGKKLIDAVDWVAGTSTGGIIALGLAHEIPVENLISLYKDDAEKIFQKKLCQPVLSLFAEKYSDKGLETELKRLFGTTKALGDLTKGIVITAVDIEGGNEKRPGPYIINGRKKNFQSLKLWEVARATAAAPTYFEPYYGLEGHSLVDGGLVANHPGMTAVAEIASLYGSEKKFGILELMKVISFGTGTYYNSITRGKSDDMGLLEWAGPISSLMMRDTSQLVDKQLKGLLGSHYLRLNSPLNSKIKLDGISPQEVKDLQNLALNYIKNNPEQITRSVEILLNQ